jgi:hypothetical protein
MGPLGQPYFITNNGLISGTAAVAGGAEHSALFYAGLKGDIDTPGLGGQNSIAFGANERGQAVGLAQTSTSDPNGEDFCGLKALWTSLHRYYMSTFALAIRRDGSAADSRGQQWRRPTRSTVEAMSSDSLKTPRMTRAAQPLKSSSLSLSSGDRARFSNSPFSGRPGGSCHGDQRQRPSCRRIRHMRTLQPE